MKQPSSCFYSYYFNESSSLKLTLRMWQRRYYPLTFKGKTACIRKEGFCSVFSPPDLKVDATIYLTTGLLFGSSVGKFIFFQQYLFLCYVRGKPKSFKLFPLIKYIIPSKFVKKGTLRLLIYLIRMLINPIHR